MARSTHFFQFEADFVETLRCIPMQVRLKLDTCGIKLKLPQWNHFTTEDRQLLVELPCHTAAEIQHYRDVLKQMIDERTGETATELPIDAHPAWQDTGAIAESVLQKAAELQIPLRLEQWASLSDEQRFALYKLSRSSHENRNFLPALREFQLI